MFASDVCGDGRLRNQFGTIIRALAERRLDLQSASDQYLANRTIDYRLYPSPVANNEATVTLQAGQVQPDTLGTFHGQYGPAGFSSYDPLVTRQPLDIKIGLQVLGLPSTAQITLSAARLTYQAGASTVVPGRLTGTIRQTEVMATVAPALAAVFTATLNADPNSPPARQIIEFFQPTHTASGFSITAAQLAGNPLIQVLFAPDVQIYDSAGRYDPNPAGAQKDSLSFGMGLSVAASPLVTPSDPVRAQLLRPIIRDHVMLSEVGRSLEPLASEIGGVGQIELFQLQNCAERYGQAVNALSAITQRLSQTQQQILQNLR